MILVDKNDSKFYLNPQLSAFPGEGDYIYNVNPSIWKISTLMEIMNKFKDKTYRTIELSETQQFCTKYKVYKLFWESYINCGWCSCMPFFQYIHLTHHGKLLPLNGGNLNESLKKNYIEILQKFSLLDTRDFIVEFDKSHKVAPEYYHGPSIRKDWS